MPFVLIGGLGLLWCGAFWPWFRDRPEEMPRVNRGERKLIASGRPADPELPQPVPWSRMLGSLSIWSLCLMYGFTGFSGNFFTNMLPLYLSEHRHLSLNGTAWLSAMPLAAGVVACILGGTASDWAIRRWKDRKWGRRFVGMIGLGLAGPAFLATLWCHDVWTLGLLLTLTFFGNDLSMGPAWASCADIGERYAGTVSGAMNMVSAWRVPPAPRWRATCSSTGVPSWCSSSSRGSTCWRRSAGSGSMSPGGCPTRCEVR